MVDETLDITSGLLQRVEGGASLALAVGIIWHPDVSRVGEFAFLSVRGKTGAQLSRTTPMFGDERATETRPLSHRNVSRNPILIKSLGGRQYEITPPESNMWVAVNGVKITGPTIVSLNDLGQDIILSLSDRVVLSLFERNIARNENAAQNGLLGISGSIRDIWEIIACAAPTELPVLIEGQTGTGKELVARAIHQLSARSNQQMLSVNMATVTGDLATADLFGAAKGAFTGAVKDRMGLFEQASDSTLFLDEIGSTSEAVQPMLLRALEAGEFRRVGEAQVRRTSARIVAATDQPLGDGQFSQPLLRRLDAVKIHMPNLNERRVDIGLLMKHFFSSVGGVHVISGLEETVPSVWAARMALYSWPGNIRELRSAVQQLVLGQQPDAARRQERPDIGKMPLRPEPRKKYRSVTEVSEEEMIAALNNSNWSIKQAAQSLNISRTALYEMIGRSPNVRKADELSDDEICEMASKTAGDIDLLARRLRVSRAALKNRLKRLSL